MKVGQEQGEMKVVLLLWISREVQKESHCRRSQHKGWLCDNKIGGAGIDFRGVLFSGVKDSCRHLVSGSHPQRHSVYFAFSLVVIGLLNPKYVGEIGVSHLEASSNYPIIPGYIS